MKIQSINQNQNVSHKAYFNQNETFRTLYKNANRNELFLEFANKCKKELPNHELIVKTEQYPTPGSWGICRIFNNTTKKITSTIIPNDNRGLIAVLAHALMVKDISDFYVEGEQVKDIDCLDCLTKKD